MILLTLPLLIVTSCGRSLRSEWIDSAKNIKDVQKVNPKQESEEELAKRLREFDQSLSVQEARRMIKRQEKQLQKALIALYDKSLAYEMLGTLYLNQKFYQAALEQFELALEIRPASATLHYYAGVSSGWVSTLSIDPIKQATYQEKALAHLLKSYEIDPNHAPTSLALASIYVQDTSMLGQAKMYVKRYQSLHPQSQEAQLLLAHITLKEGNYLQARNLYQQIIDEANRNPDLHKYYIDQANAGLALIP
nr:hypothetical protein [Entomospira culicis]